MTDTQLLASVAACLGVLKLVSDWYGSTRKDGASDANQLAALQLQQVQNAAAAQIASTQLEARLASQVAALTAQVSALAKTVADLTRDTDERLKRVERVEADTDADRRSMADALSKLGRQVDRLLVEGSHRGGSGASDDHIPAARPGRYGAGGGE